MEYLDLHNPYGRLTFPDQLWVGHVFTLVNIVLTILLWRKLSRAMSDQA